MILQAINLIGATSGNTLLFIGGLGTGEIVLILAVFLLFFGAKKIPQMARGLGEGVREFKNATTRIQEEVQNGVNTEHASPKVTLTSAEAVPEGGPTTSQAV